MNKMYMRLSTNVLQTTVELVHGYGSLFTVQGSLFTVQSSAIFFQEQGNVNLKIA